MSGYYDNAIEKIALKLSGFSSIQSFRLLTFEDQELWNKKAINFLKDIPEVAIVNRLEKISCGTFEGQAINTGWDLCKTYIENNNFVKEVKE